MAKGKEKSETHITINLNSRAKKSIETVFFKWAVSIGKLIIVITQLIALIALVYRFSVDYKIINQHDEIERQQLFLDAQKQQEAEFRALHTRLSNITELTQKNEIKLEVINAILQAIRQGRFQTTNFAVNQNRITFDGSSLSIFEINSFIDELKQNENVVAIGIDSINSSARGVTFELSVSLIE